MGNKAEKATLNRLSHENTVMREELKPIKPPAHKLNHPLSKTISGTKKVKQGPAPAPEKRPAPAPATTKAPTAGPAKATAPAPAPAKGPTVKGVFCGGMDQKKEPIY